MSLPSRTIVLAWAAAALLAAAALVARVTGPARAGQASPLSRRALGTSAEPVVELLSGIDFVPSRAPLDAVGQH